MHRTHNPTAPAANTDDLSVITPATILRGAATYLENHGWTQGRYYGANDPFPPVCADGALGMAAFGRTNAGLPGETKTAGYRDYNRARDAFNQYLVDNGHRPHCDDPWCQCQNTDDCRCDSDDTNVLFAFNDDDQRTKDDVIQALNAAADDYDWTHATEADLETYAEICIANEQLPDREGFLAWLGAR
jgi:hypothetical protein